MKFLFLALLVVSDVCLAAQVPIENFHIASSGLYRGARPSAEGLKYLKNLGVRTVVNLQGGDPKSFLIGPIAGWFEPGEDPRNIEREQVIVKFFGMQFWHAPLNSFDEVSTFDGHLIDKTLEVMRSRGPVFVHCEHGKDRTGLLVALYRVKYEGWDVESAYTEWTSLGHGWLLLLSDELDEYFFKKATRILSERADGR